MRISEILSEKEDNQKIDIEHLGNWTVAMSAMPVVMPRLTGDTAKYVAKVTHKTKKFDPIFGVGASQAEARDDAMEKAQLKIRPTDLEKYQSITVEMNVDFMREYWDPQSGGMFKLGKNEAGETVLVMASKDYYRTFKQDMAELGFKKGYVRKVGMGHNITPTQSFSISNAEMRSFGLLPNARYAVDEIGPDSDGNETFSLTFDSRTVGPGEGLRMHRPAITIAATA